MKRILDYTTEINVLPLDAHVTGLGTIEFCDFLALELQSHFEGFAVEGVVPGRLHIIVEVEDAS